MRPIVQDDLPWLIQMRSAEPVARYLGGTEMQNAAKLTERMKFYLKCHEELGYGLCVMSLKSNGEPMGTSGLQPLEDTGEIELGYNFSEKFWRQGFGLECALGWLDYGFRELHLDRIVAIAQPENVGSWRIMEKCGMKYENTSKHYGFDCVFYAISRDEFAEARTK